MRDKLTFNLQLIGECKKKKPSFEVLNSLIEKGADPKAQSKYGYTCLLRLCHQDNPSMEALKFLVEKGADLKAEQYGRSALHFLCHRDRRSFSINAMKFLIEKGANLNAKDKEGETSLNYLWQRDNHFLDERSPAKLLIAYGAEYHYFGEYRQNKLFEESDLQLFLMLLLQYQPPSFIFKQDTVLAKFSKLIQDSENKTKVWMIFQDELFGDLTEKEKREFLTDNCKYFPKAAQEKITTAILSIKHASFLNKSPLKPKFLLFNILSESLGVEILPFLIFKKSNDQLNEALEKTLQKFELGNQSQLNLK